MMNKKLLLIPILVVSLITVGFISYFAISMVSPLQVSIKDAPYDGLVSINADVASVELRQNGIGRWYTIINAERVCNCSVTGEEQEICKANLPAGTYDTIRIKFNRIRLQYNNGSLYEVTKFNNMNAIQNTWIEIPINFIYDGVGGKILFDITIDDNSTAVVTILYATP
ncbi:MAG: DUF4382 domain-containing protein [Candidatus Lokiarchaeota archaeon]|nr:DUF4382 domain-containing protein [Candidatus Lokiarchaeota archaeon]